MAYWALRFPNNAIVLSSGPRRRASGRGPSVAQGVKRHPQPLAGKVHEQRAP